MAPLSVTFREFVHISSCLHSPIYVLSYQNLSIDESGLKPVRCVWGTVPTLPPSKHRDGLSSGHTPVRGLSYLSYSQPSLSLHLDLVLCVSRLRLYS